ncbi:NAD(P)-binding protein [Schizophyllum commune H4-8]|nr:NAD(P)-binding protein [Schizophyllum commune H4-8]KAI5898286.1 NAD(P)-binding protein [Schizophyllum commune H4-8]
MNNNTDLKGKTVMVTNVASSSGRRVAMLFSQAGAKVVAVDPDDISGQKVANSIRAAGGEVMFAKCNMTEENEGEATAEAVASFGSLDSAVNIVSWGSHWHGELLDQRVDSDAFLETCLRGLRNCLDTQTAYMRKHTKGGSITFVRQSNTMADLPQFDQALIDLVRKASRVHKQANIRINVVLEPWRAPILTSHTSTDSSLALHLDALHDPAKSCLWLASEAASFVNGSVISSESGYAYAS